MSARAAASKTAEALRTIGEVAEQMGVQTHVLRFWEGRFPQIRPIKGTGGRRYYRPSDIALMRSIRWLLHDEGMTIRGVQKLLRDRGVRHVAGLCDGGAEAGAQAAPDAASVAVVPAVAAPAPVAAPAVVRKLVIAASQGEAPAARASRPRPPRIDAEQLALPGFPNDPPPAEAARPVARPATRTAPVPTPAPAAQPAADLSVLVSRLQGLRDRMANA